MNKKFNPKEIELNKYDFWTENRLFELKNEDIKKPFSILLPPPNVTGHLHLGHAWDSSLQDVIIRYKKLQGFDTLFIPGTDHAGIATQTKFEKILKEKGISKFDLGRDEFLKQLTKWAKEQADFIKKQWGSLGLSLSYENQIFTMDKDIQDTVRDVFVKLYKENLIYRKKTLVNWDPELKTAISNIEVVHKQTNSKMYYFTYYSVDKKTKLEIATTRPETMYGDVCLFANPKDKRYEKLKNIKFINPINNEEIPLLFDEYVDYEFGTGVMKCTPAHDFNDFELYKKHKLELINILNDDATLNEKCKEFEGLDVNKARELIVKKLKEEGSLIKIEDISNNVGYSERTNSVVQPYMSWQWFLKTKDIAKKIIKEQQTNKTIEFIPARFNKTLITWLENIEDWCISRQLWWGHQIPIWYHKETNEIYCSDKEPKDVENYIRDEDVLDTWFSSALWPMICFKWPNEEHLLFDKFFPSNVLVTGYDIIFFWVSRMIMQTKRLKKSISFNQVLLHGLIRDENGHKMSKSLGNGIDPMDVIEEYGADSLRLFLTSSSSRGEDLNYSTQKLRSNWNFLNKLWNGSSYIISLESTEKFNINNLNKVDSWIINKFNNLLKEIQINMDDYNFSVSTQKIINFVWNDFFNTYLDLLKTDFKEGDYSSVATLKYLLKNILIILHPQAPFVTEEIYQNLEEKELSILNESWPKEIKLKELNFDEIEISLSTIEEIRKLRLEKNIPNKKEISLNIKTNLEINLDLIKKYLYWVNSLISDFDDSNSFKAFFTNFELSINKENLIDSEEELNKHKKELEKIKFEIKRAESMLSNENFVSKAPKEKINIEKEKLNTWKKTLEKTIKIIQELEK